MTPLDFTQAALLSAKFSEIKMAEQGEPIEQADEDPIIKDIIDFGTLKIEHLDLSPILIDQEPITEVDISLLLDRPPAIPLQKVVFSDVDENESHQSRRQSQNLPHRVSCPRPKSTKCSIRSILPWLTYLPFYWKFEIKYSF